MAILKNTYANDDTNFLALLDSFNSGRDNRNNGSIKIYLINDSAMELITQRIRCIQVETA